MKRYILLYSEHVKAADSTTPKKKKVVKVLENDDLDILGLVIPGNHYLY